VILQGKTDQKAPTTNIRMPKTTIALRPELRKAAKPADRAALMRYFKTGPGEYGAGDAFLGVKVPPIRKLSRAGSELSLGDLRTLVRSRYHEERLLGLLSLVRKYQAAEKRGETATQKSIFDLYMAERAHINNWDLVDLSAMHIVGRWLENRDRRVLAKLARSKVIWDRRIAILSCFHFIRGDDFDLALEISEMLLGDSEDLIHKAVGWMLREIGNRDKKAETLFLERHADTMPRTMLRYAIEKFPEKERLKFLARGKTKR